jgi:hypothetical protein
VTRTTALLFVLLAAGCGTSDPCAQDPGSCRDAAPDAVSTNCPGECVQTTGLTGLFRPGFLLWLGPEGTTPPNCLTGFFNASAPFPGYADAPPATVDCPQCSCSGSLNECLLPDMMNAGQSPCPAPLTQPIPFNAPDPWDGTCTAINALPSAASLDIPAPSLVTLSTCAPSDAPPVMLAGGTTRALICGGPGDTGVACPNQGEVCTVSKVPGFLYCVGAPGDVATCPDGWPTRHVIYTDDAECNCSCGPVMGDECVSTLSVYSDSACTDLLAATMVTSNQTDVCINVPLGSPLGSKSSTLPVYMPGTCTPSLTKSQAQTLCCQP